MIFPLQKADNGRIFPPLVYRLLGGRNLCAKTYLTIAIVCLMATGTVAATDETGTARRNSAWTEIVTASRQGNDTSLIMAAEQFFSTKPKADSRREEALQLYERALLRWFSGLHRQLTLEDHEHLRQYKGIIVSLKNGERTNPPASQHVPDAQAHTAFSAFPIDSPRPVEINWEESALRKRSDRELMEQVRDWLLAAVVSDSDLTPREIRSALIDMPPARFGYLEPVSTFEYGELRSRSIGNGKVVALVPAKQSKDERADSLAYIADEHKKNTGHLPKELLVFEYDVTADRESATITRRDTVAGKSFFTEADGYYTANITDPETLEHFLHQVDDLTEARANGNGLWVSGRKLHAGYRGVDLEDVAALWQSEARLQKGRARAKAFLKKLDAFAAKWKSVPYRTFEEKLQLDEQFKKEEAELKAEGALFKAEFSRFVNGSGFSLDPVCDYEKLREDVEPLLPLASNVSAADRSKALEGLKNHDEKPFLKLLYSLRKNQTDPSVFELLSGAEFDDQFQAARYDGDLQGTKVGMTLFYTDLLAKLKAIDYWNDTAISDFKPLTAVQVARIYQKEEESFPNTRLWFGPQGRGYQLVNQAILFGRTATRIYAASSDTLQPGKEVPPNASSAAFLNWWDRHYEEVARFEPEYQRLNEIMKWSLVLSWLSEHSNNALVYLDSTKVNHDLWFPEWARQNHELRYQDWDRFQFHEKGYKRSTTEAMPLLYSEDYQQFGKKYQISGGVSLGSPEVIHERSLLAVESETNELLLRPGRNFIPVSSANEIEMLGGIKHAFTEESGRFKTLSSVEKAGIKFREPAAEMASQRIERAYSTHESQLDVDVRVGGADVGQFYSEVSPARPIRLGFRARDIDRGQQFAEQVSSAVAHGQEIEPFIATHPDVEGVVKFGRGMGCDECYVVKLRGVKGYLKMQPERAASIDVPAKWHARVASLDDKAQNFNLAWASQSRFDAELNPVSYVKIEARPPAGGGAVPPTFTRGPPPGSSMADFESGRRTWISFKDNQGNRYFRIKDLTSDGQDVLQTAAKLQDRIQGIGPLESAIRSGDSRQALMAIADDPIQAKQTLENMKLEAYSGLDRALGDGDISQGQRNYKVLSQLEQGPDLKIRMAVMDAETGNLEDAVQSVREALRGPNQDIDGALQDITRRLNSPEPDVAQRINLNQLASMLDLGKGRLFAHDGLISFEMRLEEQITNRIVIKPQDIHDGGPLYVLESPSAKGNTAIFASMPDQIHRDLGTILELPDSELAHARPIVIETADGARYRLAGETKTWTQGNTDVLGGPYHRYNPNAPDCSGSSQDRDEEPNDCKQRVYLFDPAPQQAAQPN